MLDLKFRAIPDGRHAYYKSPMQRFICNKINVDLKVFNVPRFFTASKSQNIVNNHRKW